jgi:hypothetical protein
MNSIINKIKSHIPILETFRDYNKGDFKGDLNAG